MGKKLEKLRDDECELLNTVEALKEFNADGEIAKLRDRCVRQLEQGDRTMQKLVTELRKKGSKNNGK